MDETTAAGEARFRGAVARWLEAEGRGPVNRDSIRIDVDSSQGCDTCGPEIEVTIAYMSAGQYRYVELSPWDLGEWIGALLPAPVEASS